MTDKAPYQPPPIDYGASLAKREVPGPWLIKWWAYVGPSKGFVQQEKTCTTPEEANATWKDAKQYEAGMPELFDATGQRWSYRLGWGWWHPGITIDWSKARG